MKLLLLGNDENILQSGSDSQQRMVGYGEMAEEIHILIFSAKKIQRQQVGNVFIYSSGGRGRLLALLRGYFLAKKIIKQSGLGAVSSQDPFEGAFIAWLLKKRFSIKLNIQVHGDFFSRNYWKHYRFLNFFRFYAGLFLLKRADSVRAVSARIKNSLTKRGIKQEKIIIAPIFTDFSEISKYQTGQIEKSGDNFIFFSACRLTKEKNIPLLLKTFANLDRKDIILRIAGEGFQKTRLVALSERLRIGDRVEFLGWLSQKDLYYQYRIADCFVLASDFEGWGLASLEAAYFNLPIIMTNVGLVGEIFISNKDILSVESRDEQGFLRAMQQIISNPLLREDLSENARLALQKLPNKEQTEELYKKMWFL